MTPGAFVLSVPVRAYRLLFSPCHPNLKFAALKTTRGANFRFYPGDYNLMILVWFKDLKLALARAV
jgi:hypothetical protein